MLHIQDIRKQYKTGDLVQVALDGVSLTLRDNEFVAILGPSGSGKTTLLNVIGGLDRYDSGDLIINGISTKKYSDRDWDSYRNHTIGFIFQSYNLIPHQSVLANVELALTISGISRSERRRRAKEALQAVGLGDQVHKRPNQMSGGQMQRVAIARALVNNPDILLADEPTGALDTATSVQIMDLLKEVAKDKLVVMVTHNPELAEEYANRIVRVKDGQIIGDTNPFHPENLSQEPVKYKNMGKASMSFWTALTLSFNNLWTKKGRTLLTAFAGSIGIIGIALIMSLSTGFQKYIDKIQEDTLSNYPLSILQEKADAMAMMSAVGAMIAPETSQVPAGVVQEQQMIGKMFSSVGKNDLASFKVYLEENYDQIQHTINAIKYSYNIKPRIYLSDTSNGVIQANPARLFRDLTGSSAMAAYLDQDIFYEMMDNAPLLKTQYETLMGRWPEAYNELLLVLPDGASLQDYTAYALRLRDPEELRELITTVMSGKEPEQIELEPGQWSYEQLMQVGLKLVPASAQYRYNEEYGVWEDMSSDAAYMKELVDNAQELKIVGIVCPKEGVSATALQSGIAYTSELTRHVISTAAQSPIVQGQLENPEIDVFTGKPFGEQAEESESSLNFENMISVDGDMLSTAFGMNISTEKILRLAQDYMLEALGSIELDTEPAQKDFLEVLDLMIQDMLTEFVKTHGDENGVAQLKMSDSRAMAEAYLASDQAALRIKPLVKAYEVSQEDFAKVFLPLLENSVTYYISSHITPVDPELPQLPEIPQIPEIPQLPSDPTELPEAFQSLTEEGNEALTVTEDETQPSDETAPQPEDSTQTEDTTQPEDSAKPEDATQPEEPTAPQDPSEPQDPDNAFTPEDLTAQITLEDVPTAASEFSNTAVAKGVASAMTAKMLQADVLDQLNRKMDGLSRMLMRTIGNSFYVDEEKIAGAFQFNMDEDALRRLMEAMSGAESEASYDANLRTLGYANEDEPTSISVYFVDFATKEEFLAFLDDYNVKMESSGQEDKIIGYADITGIMMSSVRIIIDSVSYALIAFVAVSLVVSSIMVGIITYISVMERTKEIGVLRAIGASKRNISQVFNAETFIIGLCSGLIGVGVSLLILIPGNMLIHYLTNNPDIVAQLPVQNAVALVILSVVLTLIGGLIPAKKAAKKDPVIALRSE